MLGLPELGFFSDDQETFERLIRLPDGILLVTGPTGSGKTTTLYACLNFINKPDRKIITVEEPVEYQMTGINQVQVNADVGMTFPVALRSMLRQAPNIIMIGEIRDLETADDRDQREPHRPPGFQHAAHERRAVGRRAPGRYRRAAVPRRLLRARDHGAATGPAALPELQAARRIERDRNACS